MWSAPLVVLLGIGIWQAFYSGGFMPHQWLPAALAIGLFGLVVSLAIAYPRRPRQLSLAVLALFSLYAIWVACSAAWAGSTSRVWLEAVRTGAFLLVFALALMYLTDPKARRSFRYLVMGAGFFLLAACVFELWTTDNIGNLFVENRFFFPVTYPNNAAALFLIGFWPLIWLAAGPEERAPVRGVALGLATGLLGLAMMTQSRGAIWSLGLTVILAFIIFPGRLRTLLFLAVPGFLLVYEFPSLNRYWTEGPAEVGGALAGRTLLVASIMAAFIGMILALLERWIRVKGKTKVVLGSAILIAAVAGAIYGSMALTKDVGGPLGWVSNTWKTFTGQTESGEQQTGQPRLFMVDSSGRVGIWKVAWEEVRNEPILGVGADNFVFQHDLLRNTNVHGAQHAHSIELQVLGETGVVGGVFATCAILLALGGIMWPRCVAGWRGARRSWLRRRASDGSEAQPPEPSRLRHVRWGENSIEYGWDMALVLSVSYWVIHASVDWLWQMAGVAIPMLLMLAAGVARTDARADILWPRWNRWLRVKGHPVAMHPDLSENQSESADLNESASATGSADSDVFPLARRAEQHSARRRRRAKRLARATFLQPRGLLSYSFRAVMVAVSLGVFICAGLSYFSLQYQDSALALARTDPVRAVGRAASARWLQPSDPGPYETQAIIYHNAAREALTSRSSGMVGAVLDDLALSIGSLEQALAVEQVNWILHYRAGVATLNMLLAASYAHGHDPGIDSAEAHMSVPGLEDWTAIGETQETLPEPGGAKASLAVDEITLATATRFRELTLSDLCGLAGRFLAEADARNPLTLDVDAAIELQQDICEKIAAE